MAVICSSATPDTTSFLQNFRTFPRTVMKIQGVESTLVRVDRFGNEVKNKQQRISFIDRVKGVSIKTVYIMEATDGNAQRQSAACCKCMVM